MSRHRLHQPVIVVGAGLAGLSCARALHEAGVDVLVLESSNRVGGRLGSDYVNGFILDRGFQVLLTAYPEAQRQLDYEAMELKAFHNGADVAKSGRFHRIADPLKHPADGLASLMSPLTTWSDYPRLLRLHRQLMRGSIDEAWSQPECTTLAALKQAGLSDGLIDGFFRPFFGGVMFDRELKTSSRMFRFTYRMFHEGRTVLPRRGMQAIAEQMRAAIPANKLRLSTPVVWMRDGAVTVGSGEELHAPAIVLATEFDTAGAFTGRFPRRSWRATTTLYFAADKPPYEEPILTLDGNGEGPVNHLAVLTNVQPSYAPPGAALICANIIGPADEHIEAAVRRQLSGWFGDAVHRWRLIGSYVIPHALPEETVGVLNPPVRPARVADGLYRCGDYVASASIHGALLSGRRAAEAVIADLAGAAEHAGQAASSSR